MVNSLDDESKKFGGILFIERSSYNVTILVECINPYFYIFYGDKPLKIIQ